MISGLLGVDSFEYILQLLYMRRVIVKTLVEVLTVFLFFVVNLMPGGVTWCSNS